LSGTSEIAFKAHSAADATKWYEVIRGAAGNGPTEAYSSGPTSPVESNHGSMSLPSIQTQTTGQTTGQTAGTVTGKEAVASPVAATPTGTNAADFAPMPEKTA